MVQAYMEVHVPAGAKAGQTFNVKTPDKQWMQVGLLTSKQVRQAMDVVGGRLKQVRQAISAGTDGPASQVVFGKLRCPLMSGSYNVDRSDALVASCFRVLRPGPPDRST